MDWIQESIQSTGFVVICDHYSPICKYNNVFSKVQIPNWYKSTCCEWSNINFLNVLANCTWHVHKKVHILPQSYNSVIQFFFCFPIFILPSHSQVLTFYLDCQKLLISIREKCSFINFATWQNAKSINSKEKKINKMQLLQKRLVSKWRGRHFFLLSFLFAFP